MSPPPSYEKGVTVTVEHPEQNQGRRGRQVSQQVWSAMNHESDSCRGGEEEEEEEEIERGREGSGETLSVFLF